MIGKETDKVMKELFESLFSRYQIGLEESIKDTNFLVGFIGLLYYKCHKIILSCSRSCIDSAKWIKKLKSNKKPLQ